MNPSAADNPPETEARFGSALSTTTRVGVVRVSGEHKTDHLDDLAVEEPVEIQITYGSRAERQRRTVAITMRTPGHDAELAVGFLATETILQRATDIQAITTGRSRVTVELRPTVTVNLARLERHFYTTSSCGICGKSSLEAVETACEGPRPGQPLVAITRFHQLNQQLRAAQPAFSATGGLHAAALFDTAGQLLSVREDVGRHNAVDKLLGAEFQADRWPLAERILFVSGRASFELVQKAAIAGVPIFAAVGAPSSLAVQLARNFRMTLLGFVRDGRFNIYSGAERVRA
ncbi:MAG: formate dehydrogenase accessory sulfurtransferase FdhD [Bacteroidales bacterium]|nr:formate dehydrogenase accessory sulfurtransferase FdhD [Bacteroidales bacterium]